MSRTVPKAVGDGAAAAYRYARQRASANGGSSARLMLFARMLRASAESSAYVRLPAAAQRRPRRLRV